MAAAATPPADYDSPWKDALSFYFEGFLLLLAPWLHKQIDWRYPPVFLDKELQALSRGGRNGRRYVDKLVRVQSKNRKVLYILIHIEIQGGAISAVSLAEFSERMYEYAYRIRDGFLKRIKGKKGAKQPMEIHSLGVLTESAGSDTHLVYTEGSATGTSVHFRFPVVHLAAWRERWDALEQQAASKPFALVIMAQLSAQQTRRHGKRRLASKTHITRLMYRYHYSGQDVVQVLRLIDWMMALPEELEEAFELAVAQMEQENNVAYVTSIERRSEARGEARGIGKGETGLLQRLLIHKFGPLPESLQQRIQAATPAQLETWSFNILDAQTLDEVFGD